MNRRDLIKMSDAEIEEFLHGRRTMCVATMRAGGSIHAVAMWYGFLEGAPALWTYGKSQKVLNLRRDARLTGLVEDGEDYAQLRGVELVGTGTVIEDRDVVQQVGESVYDRYFGVLDDATRQVVAYMGAKRVVVRIDVEDVVSWDHGKLGGVY